MAREVPGTAKLNQGGDALIDSVSCGSAGNCSVGGSYTDSSGHSQAFVVSQVNGTWGTAKEVPGTAKLDQGADAELSSVSCSSAGNCTGVGDYVGGDRKDHAFVISQVNGTWRTAQKVPGAAKLSQGGSSELSWVSCSSAGNCSAAGISAESSFVVSQVNGTWGTAEEIPGIAKLSHGGYSGPMSVSCGSAGNCSAGGVYTDGEVGPREAFVVSQVHGTWGKAKEVPGTDRRNQGGDAELFTVSCSSAGNCSGGGDYADGDGLSQAFVVSQVHGTWGKAKEVPGTATLNKGGSAGISSVSCTSAGNCSAAGGYDGARGNGQAFVVSQVNGTWGKAKEVPGTATLNRGGNAYPFSVSCGSAGNCSAEGSYANRPGHTEAFVVSQVHGTWGKATEVPGIAALNKGGFIAVGSLSCSSAGDCSAGASYTDSSGHTQVFVVSRTTKPPSTGP
jgi:hypothetical protein